ncbi:hypothetical protein [Massilia sp. DWR3-1-1]|uniref:hypothetical protein n=1 Tax=Massilia sp. DWR3-1-1 TaxID=2804559 RepID=UPI003CEC19C1
MDQLIVLRVSGGNGVDLNGAKLHTQAEVAKALEKICAGNSNMSVSVEVTDSESYEAIGAAIYGSHRAGFSGERFRLVINGKPQEI